jgi:hypothetical protein
VCLERFGPHVAYPGNKSLLVFLEKGGIVWLDLSAVRARRRHNQTWLPARSVHSAHRALNHNDLVTGDRADG